MNKKNWLIKAMGAFLLLIGVAANGQTDADGPDAWIDISKDDEMWQIVGVFKNDSEPKDSLRYKLEVERVGKSGKSANSQGGFFEADKDEEVGLSTVKINVAEGDTYHFTLWVYNREDEIICEKKLSSED